VKLEIPKLHFIIPCYNPDEGWEYIIVEKYLELKNRLTSAEIGFVIVNDGSTYGVDKGIIDFLNSRISNLQLIQCKRNHGKGYALRKGVEALKGDYFIYTDIDFPYTIESIITIYNRLIEGADVVIGIREPSYYKKVPMRRAIISKGVKKLIKYLLKTDITDTQCGLKGFNEKGKQVFLRTTINRFLFDMQFVQIASHEPSLNLKLQTVYTREGVLFSHMNAKVLLGESFNFLKLIFLPKKGK